MRLSEITTVDALILQLAARGYRNFQRSPELDLAEITGFYEYSEQECPSCRTQVRQLSIWPRAVTDRGEVGFAATIDEQGSIIAWFGFEQFAGSTLDLDGDCELDSICAALDAWQAEAMQ